MDFAIFGIVGLGVGLLVGWLATRARAAGPESRAALLEERLARLDADLCAEREKALATAGMLATREAEVVFLKQRLSGDAERLADLQSQMKLEFENLSSRLLEEKSEKFLEKNQQSLTALLGPLRERLGEFRERMETLHTEEEKSTSALVEQLRHLRELNQQMAEETGHLTNALKGQSKSQGSWGELVLERILEKSGLTSGLEYETQTSHRDADGSRKMPDVIIRLPEGKCLIIDAKVSLTAYERSVNAETEASRLAALREHAGSLRRHIDELSHKDYAGLAELQTPDFVLMFVPIEPALSLALQHDPSLYGDAFDKNVILVSSSTLLVSLRAVESVWRHHKQTLNAQEIARQAGNLHDAFVNFTETLQEIGNRLEQARGAYDLALTRLTTGRGNLVKRTLDLQKLGARGEKQLAAPLARLALEEDSE